MTPLLAPATLPGGRYVDEAAARPSFSRQTDRQTADTHRRCEKPPPPCGGGLITMVIYESDNFSKFKILISFSFQRRG